MKKKKRPVYDKQFRVNILARILRNEKPMPIAMANMGDEQALLFLKAYYPQELEEVHHALLETEPTND